MSTPTVTVTWKRKHHGRAGCPDVYEQPLSAADMVVEMDGRPLVIIDPEDREQVERLNLSLMDSKAGTYTPSRVAAALRSLIAVPKPEEPTGRYAAIVDADGGEWVRLGDGPRPWMHNGSPANSPICAYADITAVKVLSDGVTP